MNLFIFGMFFLSLEIDCFFFGNRQHSNARAGREKNMCFILVMRGLNPMRALI